MKSIFVVATILVLLALFLLIYWNQAEQPIVSESPLLPGIETFRGPPSPVSTGNISPTSTGIFSSGNLHRS